MHISFNRRGTMKAAMPAAILFFVLGVSHGRSRFPSSEVNDDADNVTIPGKFTDCGVTYRSLLQPSGMIEQLKTSKRTRGRWLENAASKRSQHFFFAYTMRLSFAPNSRK